MGRLSTTNDTNNAQNPIKSKRGKKERKKNLIIISGIIILFVFL